MHLEKNSSPNDIKSLWEVKLTNLNDELRKKRCFADEGAKVFPLEIEMLVGVEKETQSWMICIGGEGEIKEQELKSFAKKNKMKARGGVAALYSASKEYKEKGRLYSFLPLPQKTSLPVHLNGIWASSSVRENILLSNDNLAELDRSKLEWNRFILLEILPPLYVKLLKALVKFEEKRDVKHKKPIIDLFWPLPDSQLDYITEFGIKVLKALPTNVPLFWSIFFEGGSYVNLDEACFGHEYDDLFIFKILADYGNKSVKLTEKQLDGFKKAEIDFSLISPKQVHETLKNQDISKHYDWNDLIKLLKFFIKDKDYSHLKDIEILPLANNEFAKFGDPTNYYLATKGQRDLLPNVGNHHFVHDICVFSDKILKEIFNSKKFQDQTNVKKFDAKTLAQLLDFELIHKSIPNWDPNSHNIPNKNWIDEIWNIILNSKANLNLFEQFPILDICYPCSELTFLNSRMPVLECSQNMGQNDQELVDILCKFGHKFTLRRTTDISKNYIIKRTPGNVIKLIDEARTKKNKVFSCLSENEICSIRNYIVNNWWHLKSESKYNHILRKLSIWPTFPKKNEYKSPPDGLLFPEKISMFSLESRYTKQAEKPLFFCQDDQERNILKELGANVLGLSDFVRSYFEFPRKLEGNYVQFIKSILKSPNFREIESWISNKCVIPQRFSKNLKYARDLYDYNVDLFRITFESSEKFLHHELQSDSECLEVIKRMGFKDTVTVENFLSCARAIDEDSQNRRSRINENVLNHRAVQVVNYLYDNFNNLPFSENEWSNLVSIRFVPTSNIDSLYSEIIPQKFKNFGKFQCFKSLCLPKYKSIAWTQVGFLDVSVIPSQDSSILKKEKFGTPSADQVLDHLREIAENIFKPESRKLDKLGNLNFRNILNDIYKFLDSACEDEVLELGKCDFKTKERIFLNIDPNENPYDARNWVAASELILNVSRKEDGFVKDSLSKYESLLKTAGSGKVFIPRITPNFTTNNNTPNVPQSQRVFDGLTKFLLDGSHLHDVTFIVKNEEIRANRYVLAAASDYFYNMFCKNYQESNPTEPPEIPGCDIDPKSFRIFLSWLYGEPHENILGTTNSEIDILSDESNSNNGSDFSNDSNDENAIREVNEELFCLLMDLLKASDYYNDKILKDKLEAKLAIHVKLINVEEIRDHANKCQATYLRDYCEKFIETNSDLL
ncbi:hypothetical protein Glove_38g43 [Diversispora epigaea]|uniref:BTB domain-containing protein n=1 Tax=Diversispora epigaea TaxID=1348612 RepID=A0A397JJ01_9GLOM|nr:hypothetical protein Glove_38g43 [Diversispora epigaea]